MSRCDVGEETRSDDHEVALGSEAKEGRSRSSLLSSSRNSLSCASLSTVHSDTSLRYRAATASNLAVSPSSLVPTTPSFVDALFVDDRLESRVTNASVAASVSEMSPGGIRGMLVGTGSAPRDGRGGEEVSDP